MGEVHSGLHPLYHFRLKYIFFLVNDINKVLTMLVTLKQSTVFSYSILNSD